MFICFSYALARHLRQNETIHPLVELGKFRGEQVYSRSAVVSLKTAENWMRSGRKIREGCQPMKWVKQRASTVSRRRELEMALEKEREMKEKVGQPSSEIGEDVMQGLYAESQTELYRPEPIVNVCWHSYFPCIHFVAFFNSFFRGKFRRMISVT
jgi:xeroderma pigmentosum group C-complementing protein